MPDELATTGEACSVLTLPHIAATAQEPRTSPARASRSGSLSGASQTSPAQSQTRFLVSYPRLRIQTRPKSSPARASRIGSPVCARRARGRGRAKKKAREQRRKGGRVCSLLSSLHLHSSTRRPQVLPLGLCSPLRSPHDLICSSPSNPFFPCKITNQVHWIGPLCPPHLGFGGHLCTMSIRAGCPD
jgi:hypothetical protein